MDVARYGSWLECPGRPGERRPICGCGYCRMVALVFSCVPTSTTRRPALNGFSIPDIYFFRSVICLWFSPLFSLMSQCHKPKERESVGHREAPPPVLDLSPLCLSFPHMTDDRASRQSPPFGSVNNVLPAICLELLLLYGF